MKPSGSMDGAPARRSVSVCLARVREESLAEDAEQQLPAGRGAPAALRWSSTPVQEALRCGQAIQGVAKPARFS